MKRRILPHLLVLLSALFLFSGNGWAANIQVDMKLPPEAQVTKFDCSLGIKKKMSDKPVTIYDFSVKNISDKPVQYAAYILVPETGQSAGGFIPRKGKPPQLKPGEEMNFKWAVRMFEMPKEKVKLIIETL